MSPLGKGTLSPKIDRTDDPLEVPIGPSALLARTMAGIGSLGIAWLMFASGSAMAGFLPYLLMVFYVGMGLWVLATVRNEIIVRQFALEIIILVFVSVTVRLLYPQVFESEYDVQQGTEVAATVNKFDGYLARSGAFGDELVKFLSGATIPDDADITDSSPSRKALDATWKELKDRYRTAASSSQVTESRKGFQMHESYQVGRELYETIAPEVRRLFATKKAGREVKMVIAGPVAAKANELLPQWKEALKRLEEKGVTGERPAP